jgi:hypothetical protein
MHYHADYNTGTNTIYAGGDKESYLLLPIIPASVGDGCTDGRASRATAERRHDRRRSDRAQSLRHARAQDVLAGLLFVGVRVRAVALARLSDRHRACAWAPATCRGCCAGSCSASASCLVQGLREAQAERGAVAPHAAGGRCLRHREPGDFGLSIERSASCSRSCC